MDLMLPHYLFYFKKPNMIYKGCDLEKPYDIGISLARP
jgi:hypothetical protein